jgi:Glycosyltransferase family 87
VVHRADRGAVLAGSRGGWASEPARWLLVLLWAAALVALAISLWIQYRDPVLPGDPWQTQGQLGDFRDSVWTPGGYLLGGHNPYDTGTYLRDVPWTQGLALYAPAWLLVGLSLGWLPFLLANALYQVLGIAVCLVLVRTVLRLTLPRFVAIGTPIGMVWLVVWAAGRYALSNVSTALVVLGVILVLRGVWLARVGTPALELRTSMAIGVGLAMVKPQFGLIVLVVALAAGRWDAVWRGLVGLSVLSLPPAIACVVASGGPAGFLAGIGSNLDRSTSAESAVGLDSPFNVSIDLIGQLGRLGIDAPTWVRLAVPVLAFALVWWMVRRSPSLIVLSTGVCTVLLLSFVHQFYDLMILLLPLGVGIGWLAEHRAVSVADRLRWLCAAFPTVHVHRISTTVVPGLTTTGADRIDTGVLIVGFLLSLAATLRRPAREPDAAPEPIRPAAA